MKLSWREYPLQLKSPFRIARGVREKVPVVLVELEHDGLIGYGEASPLARYGESVETSIRFLERIDLSIFSSPLEIEDILAVVDALAPGHHSAKCAIDIALHDWMGRSLQKPLHELWKFDSTHTAPCSFTIGIGSEQEIAAKIAEAEAFPLLKIKLGSEHDEVTMQTVRRLTDKRLCVDANEGWTTRELALERLQWLESYDVEFVEQPMPAAQTEDVRWLKERCKLPLIADESFVRLCDLPSISETFDGINIKLMKCTGLGEARKIIRQARERDLKILLGCMIESSVGISAAAQLSPLVDYADLDGNILISNDPFDGIRNQGGRLILNEEPGIGVTRINL